MSESSQVDLTSYENSDLLVFTDAAASKVKDLIKQKLDRSKEQREKKQRCLSSHVCSRWFRAPEIILVEKQYDTASDMWSLGCITYDLIKMSKG